VAARRQKHVFTICLWATLAMLVALPGCRGCRQETPEEAAKREAEERAEKEKPKPKPDFEYKGLVAWPSDQITSGVKPGHWTSIVFSEAKMNNFDFLGDWEIVPTDRSDNQESPSPLPATGYTLSTSRQVALPKGQAKTLESLVLLPPIHREMGLSCQLRGRQLFEEKMPMLPMPSYQYHFVVLAREPERYTYLSNLNSVKPRSDPLSNEQSRPHYRVTRALPGVRPPLPSHSLLWTSIAYILWDDLDPAALDADQQRALLDWLHWGGQLIISGPDTLDGLSGSFLAPYLPATSAGARELKSADLEEMNQRWTPAAGRELRAVRPWAGVRLKKHADAQFIPDSGDLLVERSVGRGRIVVSAFRLGGNDLLSWPGWDGMFNACLLRRPARVFVLDRDEQLRVHWADTKAYPQPLDAQLNSNVRFFSRDTGVTFAQYAADVTHDIEEIQEQQIVPGAARYRRGGYAYNGGNSYTNGSQEPPPGAGVAAWNDFNPVAAAARQSLQEAAGIKVLDRMFVVWIVAGYVIVLVPLNWLVFRLLGRVEWAWAAAPLIAVVCTIVVIHMAQLDIGFVRAQNEIAVVELQNDYNRAHVTRYMALYSSLGTGYNFRFEKPGSLLLPFPTCDGPNGFHLLPGQSYGQIACRHGDDTSMGGFYVGSNSIGFVHSENWIDMPHPLSIMEQSGDSFKIANKTQFTIRDAGVIKKTADGMLQTAWLGTIDAGATAAGQFGEESAHVAEGELLHRLVKTVTGTFGDKSKPATAGSLWQTERDRSPRTASSPVSGELGIRRLIDIAQDSADMLPGQIRLVGWLDDALPGMVVQPVASQSRHAAVVVANLNAGQRKPPLPDTRIQAQLDSAPNHSKITGY
jgi:hypothetical protein